MRGAADASHHFPLVGTEIESLSREVDVVAAILSRNRRRTSP